MNHETAYALVKAAGSDYEPLVQNEIGATDALRTCRVAEMLLVKVYDDWYFGDPRPNISKAIHEHCSALHRKADRPLVWLRRTACYLAWAYARLEHDSDDAFVLLDTVSKELEQDGGRLLPQELRAEVLSSLARWRTDRGIPTNLNDLSKYEREVWDEITRWEITPASKWDAVNHGLDAVKDGLTSMAPEAVVKPIMDAMEGLLVGLRDVAEVAVRDTALIDEVNGLGHGVKVIRDLRRVPLELLDKISGNSVMGGKLVAAMEGAGMGLGGFVLIAADIPALLTIIFRYIRQIAHTYGFATDSEEERVFILNLLGAGSTDQGAKTAFLHNLNRVAMSVAKNAAWKDLEKNAMVALIRKIAQAIGVRLTKRKLAQLIPVLGVLVGGGANYHYADDVLEAARFMYRKRWLIHRCENVISYPLVTPMA